MDIILLQTSDAHRYHRMLQATSRTAIEFCRRHGHRYESYTGVKRGHHGWQATFNRIYQFKELVDRDFRGWALYLDADAFVYDLDFDLIAYLGDKTDRSGVMTTIPGADHPWSINAGVMMLNLGHAHARQIIDEWLAAYLNLSDDRLRSQTVVLDQDNDQHMLFEILNASPELRSSVYFEDSGLMNLAESRFIRQYLASLSSALDARILAIEGMVDAVLPDESSRAEIETLAESIVQGLYKAVLGRDADATGIESYSPVIRELGPQHGVERVTRILMNSDEYRARL